MKEIGEFEITLPRVQWGMVSIIVCYGKEKKRGLVKTARAP